MPSLVSFETPAVRRSIIASYWLFGLLAICVWWLTTNIERLSLPESEIRELASRTLRLPVDVSLGNYMNLTYASAFENELRQATSDSRLDIRTSTSPVHAISYQISSISSSSGCEVYKRTLSCPLSYAPSQVAALAAELLDPYPKSFIQHLVVKHAPRYRLAFSLLNEDATTGRAMDGWDIEGLISRHIMPTLHRLSLLHNFTVESQIRYQSPLAFIPQAINTTDGVEYGLTPSELTIFVNSADWSLSSSASDDPVLHFLAFVPSSGRRPLRLLDASGQSTQFNSFILPQWGGIVILNPDSRSSVAADLDASFHTFRSQLSSLLGVHPFPHGVVNTKGRMSISDWQLDSLMRRRLLETTSATQETLSSIVKLVNQIENMPLGPGVRNDVRDSLAYMRNVFAHSDSSIDGAVADAITASTLSSQAFFNPGMLALLYFPAEHIWVIYTPLFVPVGIPLLAAAVREFKSWRAGRRLGA